MQRSNVPLWLLPMATAITAAKSFTRQSEGLMRGLLADQGAGHPKTPWTTDNRARADLTTMILRDFSTGARAETPLLIAAPFAIHDATIADLATGHSLIATIRDNGRDQVFLTDWKSGESRACALGVDAYFADINLAVDLLGGHVDLIGLCQGGWMAMLFAAIFPEKVRRLVLAGAPIDIEAAPSLITRAIGTWPQPVIAGIIEANDGLAPTSVLFNQLIAFLATTEAARQALQSPDHDDAAIARFHAWNQRNFDLPEKYFLQVLDWVFTEKRIARGVYPLFGHDVDLRRVRAPLYLLGGGDDDFVPPAQTLGATRLVGTSPNLIKSSVLPGCGHLDLFLGARSLRDAWPDVIAFLRADD